MSTWWRVTIRIVTPYQLNGWKLSTLATASSIHKRHRLTIHCIWEKAKKGPFCLHWCPKAKRNLFYEFTMKVTEVYMKSRLIYILMFKVQLQLVSLVTDINLDTPLTLKIRKGHWHFSIVEKVESPVLNVDCTF